MREAAPVVLGRPHRQGSTVFFLFSHRAVRGKFWRACPWLLRCAVVACMELCCTHAGAAPTRPADASPGAKPRARDDVKWKTGADADADARVARWPFVDVPSWIFFKVC
jgi:hypothetical protein